MKKIGAYFILLALFAWACGSKKSNKANNSVKADSVQVTKGFVNNNNVKLYYETVGQGQPILILNDGPGFVYNYLTKYFNKLSNHHKLIYFDQRGSGKSSFPADSSFSLNNYLSDIAAIQTQLGIKKINLLGHSFGAFLAEVYAAKYPSKVNTLVLSDPFPVTSLAYQQDINRAQSKRNDQQNKELISLMQSKAFKSYIPDTFEKAYEMLQRINVRDSSVSANLFDSLKFTSAEAKNYLIVNSRAGKMLLNYDLTDTLKLITAPTLILHGAMDNFTLSDMQDLQTDIQHSELSIIRNSVHYSFAENTKDYFTQLDLFYSKNLKNSEK